MATWYNMRYGCIACGYCWEVRSRDKLRNFTQRKCRACEKDKAKVTYIGKDNPQTNK